MEEPVETDLGDDENRAEVRTEHGTCTIQKKTDNEGHEMLRVEVVGPDNTDQKRTTFIDYPGQSFVADIDGLSRTFTVTDKSQEGADLCTAVMVDRASLTADRASLEVSLKLMLSNLTGFVSLCREGVEKVKLQMEALKEALIKKILLRGDGRPATQI
jgi:hypothetical protein